MNTEQKLEQTMAALNAVEATWKKDICNQALRADYSRARDEVLALQRILAAERGEAYAAKWDIPAIWKGMSLDFIVVGDQLRCFIMFEVEPMSGKFKVLEFRQIVGYRMTDVNDEVIAAHSLADRGLAAYGAFVIENSPWLKELELVNSSHPNFDRIKWQKTRHYLLCFKDRMFEALAMEAMLAFEANAKETAVTTALNRLGLTQQ